MTTQPFLFINDEPISQDQVFTYLQSSGQLEAFLEEILSQHAISQEFQAHPELNPTEETFEQLLETFRQERQLEDDEVFAVWLEQNDLDEDTLAATLIDDWTSQQLLDHITQAKLREYFIQRKLELDRVCLSCIVVATKSQAEEIREQISQGTATFEALAMTYSLAENRQTGGVMPPLSRESLADELRAELDAIQLGELVGPLAIETQWCLFRLDQILPAALEDEVAVQLKTELFQKWLVERMDAMSVKFEVTEWLYL